jgi:hypothetical protein
LQVLRTMAGELILPPEVRPFTMTKPHENMDNPETRLNDLSDTDLLVIELSSAKEVVFRDYYLQLVLTRRQLWAARCQPVRRWWREMEHDASDVDDRAALLAGCDIPPGESAVVMEAWIRIQGADVVRSDMEVITRHYSGPILFVTHFDTPKPEGGKVFGRADLISAIKAAGAELGCRVFDPTDEVLAYAGEHGDLTAAITDMGHYTDAFMQDALTERIHAEALAAIQMRESRLADGIPGIV